MHPYYAAERGLVDDVIDPAETREVLDRAPWRCSAPSTPTCRPASTATRRSNPRPETAAGHLMTRRLPPMNLPDSASRRATPSPRSWPRSPRSCWPAPPPSPPTAPAHRGRTHGRLAPPGAPARASAPRTAGRADARGHGQRAPHPVRECGALVVRGVPKPIGGRATARRPRASAAGALRAARGERATAGGPSARARPA